MNQALVLRSFQLRTSDGKNQHLYLLGEIVCFSPELTERVREFILDSVLLSLVPNGTVNDVAGEGLPGLPNLIEHLQHWR